MLGLKLLDRSARPLRFTEDGQRLLRLAGSVLPLVEQAGAELDRRRRPDVGRLHIAMECHSCFDWLFPTLDAYRARRPDVDVDIKLDSLFRPLDALLGRTADAVLCTDPIDHAEVRYFPLFRYQTRLIVSRGHALAQLPHVAPQQLVGETFITYPVEQTRLDVFRRFLQPAGIVTRPRRTAELTAMIVQWVASGHGIAALPSWAVEEPVKADRVRSLQLGTHGLFSDLSLALRTTDVDVPYLQDFILTARSESSRVLSDIQPLGGPLLNDTLEVPTTSN